VLVHHNLYGQHKPLQGLATGAQIQTAINAALVGTLEFKGGFNAGTGAIDGGTDNLTTGPARVAVAVGDFYVVTTAGSFYGSVQLDVGDQVIAQTAAVAGASAVTDWIEVEGNIVDRITGSGTVNKIPLFIGSKVLGDSVIAQSGTNIGIGTTSSLSDVLTVDDTHPKISMRDSGTERAFFEVDSADNFVINNKSASAMILETSDTERMRITSAGNVGIGTTSPAEKLTVSGNGNFIGKLAVGSSSAHPSIAFYNQNDAYFNGAVTIDDTFTQSGGAVSSFSGNVGIGTASPAVTLDISATDAIQLPKGTTTNRGAIAAPANGMLRYNTTDNSFEGYINGAWGAIGGSSSPTITVNTGAGNAATTVYPLSVTPLSVNYVNVFINGVYQAKSSYSVSGTNLTFATAPPLNSVIEFVTTT